MKNRFHVTGANTKVSRCLGGILAAAVALLFQASALAQGLQGGAVHGPDGQLLQDPAFLGVVGNLERGGEDAGVLSEPEALRMLGDASVGSLLAHRNRYIKALAISELRMRKDATHRGQIHKMFRDVSVDTNELHSDPHESAPLSPDAAVLVAAAEYLASADKGTFLPNLLGRPEVWVAPHWFVPAVRHLGPGWNPFLAQCLSRPGGPQRSGFSAPCRRDSGKRPRTPGSARRRRARSLVKCRRRMRTAGPTRMLGRARCIPRRSRRPGPVDGPHGRVAETARQCRGPVSAAQSLVTLALHVPPGPDRARMWNKLDEFVRLALAGSLAIPRSLVTSLRALGSPVIVKDLTGALVK